MIKSINQRSFNLERRVEVKAGSAAEKVIESVSVCWLALMLHRLTPKAISNVRMRDWGDNKCMSILLEETNGKLALFPDLVFIWVLDEEEMQVFAVA